MGVIGSVKNWADAALTSYIQKAMPAAVGGGMSSLSPVADAFRRRAQPTRRQLLDSVRGFSYACVCLNANGVASVPLRLFRRKPDPHQAPITSKLGLKLFEAKGVPADRRDVEYLREFGSPHARAFVRKFAGGDRTSGSDKLEEITDEHQILDVLKNVNPWMNQYELVFLTQFELEVTGESYWLPLKNNAGGVGEIWPLESWRMRPLPSFDGNTPLQGWEYSGQRGAVKYAIDDLIQFRFVSPHDPYASGYSPIRAAFEYVELANELHAYETAIVNNRARPDMMITPRDTISRGMAQRLERRINERFRRGGAGGILVGEYGYDVKPFVWSPTDLGNIAMRKACEDVIAADMNVPLSLLRADEINRATAEAGHYQHAKLAIRPRCVLLEQKLNERFTPLFGEDLLLAFDNPVPEDADRRRADRQSNLAGGVTSINEEREKEGLPPLPGGDEPMINPAFVPLSMFPEFARANLANAGQAGGKPPGRGSEPGQAPLAKHLRRRQLASLVDEQVRKILAEEREAYATGAESIWPDLAFTGRD
jgi:HK97 family phage portal protein